MTWLALSHTASNFQRQDLSICFQQSKMVFSHKTTLHGSPSGRIVSEALVGAAGPVKFYRPELFIAAEDTHHALITLIAAHSAAM